MEARVVPEAAFYWLQLADFFQWPHVTYFDNITDLDQKLEDADFKKIHSLMAVEVERRKKELLHTWCQALDKIETGRLKITVKHFSNFIVSPDFQAK